ncbi:hypothetical protein FO519_004472 [Halicephalobus sp. NKZ332]|nr:hypothetical protein FO519_004472 [Halicephalobus sp. NKZ332]
MGSVCSTPKVMTSVVDGDENVVGAAESGKTTLLSQIRMLHKQPFSNSELIHRRAFIYANILNSMKIIINYAEANNLKFSAENQKKAKEVLYTIEECIGPFNEEEFQILNKLWKDPVIQEAYKRRGEYNLNDSTRYFFDNLERINKSDFQPTSTDLIRAYCPTIGIQNIVFTAKNRSFQLFDIGGQKVDRRKWATMYDGLDAIFFCLAISEYDQKFEDDERESRLMDSLNLLEQICEEPKFESTPIFVFMNEADVLKEKLGKFPLKDYLPDYEGKNEKEAMDFLLRKVEEKCKYHDENLISIQYTCLIDNDEMEKILDNVFKQLLKMMRLRDE